MLHVDHSLTLTEGGQNSLGTRGPVFTRHRQTKNRAIDQLHKMGYTVTLSPLHAEAS